MTQERARLTHFPPEWTAEKRKQFEAWLNDELAADEQRTPLANQDDSK